MRVFFGPAAETELEEAYDYLESQRPGLGDEFSAEVERGVRRITETPEAWSEIEPGFRRFRLARFKYGLVYRITSVGAEIVSVMHLARRPGYWHHNIQ
jgi:plasmid stabilization system protein ParE